MNACRSCKTPIRWAVTVKGAAIPLDLEPAPRGTMRLEPTLDPSRPRAVFVPELEREQWAGRLYLTHFATCSYAEEHRRR